MVTALYRRYRPDTFSDVIGQDHVTQPLMRALRHERIGHAYLFSGPRGCGKTTSARILARCLNCAEGPTDTPCGVCDSCVDLASGGSGSLDVVEIDAASHGGVDDARELRERATFAPARDRFKIFIIDEAHMVTSAGFNALLKLVEEPPPHVKFIFATTEPDKVIGTIRSRTHHYPFRLIPPQILTPYIADLCRQESVNVEPAVLPLVVRAGGGSARDTLSVLDQLMAGASEDGVDYAMAVALLGFTDADLLDRVIDGIGRHDAREVYGGVEQVIASGQEPRRFVEDVLERLRDLIVIAAVPDRAQELLPEVPADQLDRLREQVKLFTPAQLSAYGEIVDESLSTMVGATSPRLHLELLCARLLLQNSGAQPAAAPVAAAPAKSPVAHNRGAAGGQTPATAGAEPRGENAGGTADGARASEGVPTRRGKAPETAEERARRIARERAEAARGRVQAAQTSAPKTDVVPAEVGAKPETTVPSAPNGRTSASQAAPAAQVSEPVQQTPEAAPAQNMPTAEQPAPAQNVTALAQSEPAQEPGQPGSAAPSAALAGGVNRVEEVKEHWSALMDVLQNIRRPSHALVNSNAQPEYFDGQHLVLGFKSEGLVRAFERGTAAANLAQAAKQVLHANVEVHAQVFGAPINLPGGNSAAGVGNSVAPTPKTAPAVKSPAPAAQPNNAQQPGQDSNEPTQRPAQNQASSRSNGVAQRPQAPTQTAPVQQMEEHPEPPMDDDWDDYHPNDGAPQQNYGYDQQPQHTAQTSGNRQENLDDGPTDVATAATEPPEPEDKKPGATKQDEHVELPESKGKDGLPADQPRTHGQEALTAALAAYRDGQNPLVAAAGALERVAAELESVEPGNSALQAESVIPSEPQQQPVAEKQTESTPPAAAAQSISSSAGAASAPGAGPVAWDSPSPVSARTVIQGNTRGNAHAESAPDLSKLSPRARAEALVAAGETESSANSSKKYSDDDDITGGASIYDEDADESALTGSSVVEEILGGKVIEVQKD